MKIKMIHEITGLVDGKPWPPRGEVIDINEDEAKRLIGIGAAEVPGEMLPPLPDSAYAEDAVDLPEATVADATDVETAAVATEPKKRAARRA